MSQFFTRGSLGSQERRTYKLIDLVPATWFRRPEDSSIWIAAYRALRINKDQLLSGPRVVDVGQVRAIMLYGTLRYLPSATIQIVDETNWRFDGSNIKEIETPEGPYVLLVTPFKIDGTEEDEPSVRKNIQVAAGLLGAFNGRNIIYHHIYDNVFELKDGRTTSFSPALDNPFWFRVPNVAQERTDTIMAANAALKALDQTEANRIRLSLRWLESAIHESGVDAFLKYWIAIETLSMPDETNVKPLNEALSKAYGVSIEQAKMRFMVRRLHGLRSRIVHDGHLVPIHGNLLRYLEALYTDVLFLKLDLKAEFRVDEVLTEPDFKLHEYLSEKHTT